MSINGSLQIGRSAMLASQAALQVAGDNMANAATPGFHRRTVHMSPLQGPPVAGHMMGQGVQLTAIRREIDTALQSRFRDAFSRESAAVVDQRFLTAMETLQNELTDHDLSSQLSKFFNGWSELANNPGDTAIRGVVMQQGQTLADQIASLRSEYGRIGNEIDQTLTLSVSNANDLLGQIAALNAQISSSEIGQNEAGSLRDQRDMLLDELAQYMDISVIEHAGGSVDVLVGSTPMLLGGASRGIELRNENIDGKNELSIRVKSDGTKLKVPSGTIGGLMRQRAETVEPMTKVLDDFAGQLIFQVNRVHSQGQGKSGMTSATGTYAASSASEPLNSADADLPFRIENGSFFIHVTHSGSETRTAHEINVNGDNMSLSDLVNEINAAGVPNITASIGPGNTLQLTADSGYTMSFSDDTSGALAALGINTFFTGHNAANIDVNRKILEDPSLLAAGAGHVGGSNDIALALANLQDISFSELGGKSLREHWQHAVSDLAVKTSAANSAVGSTRLVRESLDAQIQSVSGVSLDEESINLLMFQRQFQAAARFIGVIDDTMQTLINL